MTPVQNKRSVIVGIFIFFGIAILATAVVVVGGKRKTFAKTMTLYAMFPNVDGLQRGNNVWFSGVKIGMVKHIRVIGNGKVRVELKVEQDVQRYILADARARVGNDGLIGNKVIEIVGGTMGSAPIAADDTLLAEVGPNMADMTATLQQSNHNISIITDNFRRVSEQLVRGEGTIGTLLTNDHLAQQLSATASQLQVAANNITALTSNMNAYTAKLQKKGSLTNDLVTDTMIFHRLRTTAAQVQSASAQIQTASANATELTANLKQISTDLKTDMNNNNNLVGTLLRDTSTAANMRSSIANIQAGTKKFDENMEALQHNFLLRGFFRKREKQQARQRKQEQQVPDQSAPVTPVAGVH